MRINFDIFPCPSVSICSGLQWFISFAPKRHRAKPENFLHHTKASPLGLARLTVSCPPKCALSHLSFHNHLGPSHLPGSFLCAASPASQATMFACRRKPLHSILLCSSFPVHKNPLFFWHGCEFFTISPFFHQTTKTCCMLQLCVHNLAFLGRLRWSYSAPSLSRPSSFHPSLARLPSYCLQ